MAKCVGPLHSSEARGRMGGLIYNTFRGMATVKAKHACAQPRTQLQLAVRSRAVDLSRSWASNAYQSEWNTYAADHPYLDGMGLTIRATGANWYIGLNSRLVSHGNARIEEPPSVAAPITPTSLVATGGSGTLTIGWADPGAADDRIEFWVDGPRSTGRQSSIAKIKYNQIAAGNAADVVISGLLAGRYTVWARSFGAATGLVSTWVLATDDVT
jgi:hypothetical protein